MEVMAGSVDARVLSGCMGVINGLLAPRSDLLGSDFVYSKTKNAKAEPCLPCAGVSIETLSPVSSMPVICAGALPPQPRKGFVCQCTALWCSNSNPRQARSSCLC